MNIAVTLPADATVLGAEPVVLPFPELSPLRPGLRTVTQLCDERRRLLATYDERDTYTEGMTRTHYLGLSEDALGWTPANSAEELMMQIEVMDDNESSCDVRHLFNHEGLTDRSTRKILEMFLEGLDRLKAR
jgi:hypothetical protein